MPISVIRDLEQDELAGPKWVHRLPTCFRRAQDRIQPSEEFVTYRKGKGRHQSANKASPHGLVGEVVAHFLFRSLSAPRDLESATQGGDCFTSIANITPPMGDPNATATPAALEAVKISRILAEEPMHQNAFHVLERDRMLTLTISVLAEQLRHVVTYTTCHMHTRSLFSDLQSTSNGQGQRQALDDQRPTGEETVDDESANDAFDFGDSGTRCIGSE